MLDDVRKYVEAAFESLNSSRARELAGQLVKGQPAEQVNRVARDLAGWSQRTRERIAELVQAEVKRQLKGVGIATRDDLDTLRARVRELERAGATGGRTAKRTSAKKSSAKKTRRKKSSTKKSTASARSGAGSPASGSQRGTGGPTPSSPDGSGSRRSSG
jgi:polyhydroxyalkanoate synthesis regulator phasin